ncbi:MAG: FAD-binding oxidoreductase [Rhizobiaceae bacterium]|nr:FAD-binding oxidoreductase [Rhizobiaceae bacterium]
MTNLKHAIALNGPEARALEQHRQDAGAGEELAGALAQIVGAQNVATDFDTLIRYGRDCLPYAKYLYRSGDLPGTLPAAVVRPANTQEMASIVKLTRERGARVIPVGTCSGVLGGAIPLCREISLDTSRMDKIVKIDEVNRTVTVQAGMNGGDFEQALNEKGWTAGHYPQSINISTVGGWAACRGGGQASSRFGKIEDIVIGLTIVLPDGEVLAIAPQARRAVGPSVKDIFIGSEGTLGIVTELTLRIWAVPQATEDLVIAFPDVGAATSCARDMMQAELRPAIVRIYDAEETASRTSGLDVFQSLPVMMFLSFSGLRPLVAAEKSVGLEIVARHGGKEAPTGPFRDWRESRYVSASQSWTDKGYFMDTVEVTLPWSTLVNGYERMAERVRAVSPDAHFGAHWSHVYPDGACQYMTFRLPPMPDAEALPLHAAIWDALQEVALDCGGTISHHHGVGVFRGKWMRREHGVALDVLQALKDALDPGNLFNPGKMGLRQADGAVRINP